MRGALALARRGASALQKFYVSIVLIFDLLQPKVDEVIVPSEKMPLYPHSILKKPSEFPPVPFDLEDNLEDIMIEEDDNDSLDVILPNRDLNDFSDFDRPTAKPGKHQSFHFLIRAPI